LDQEDIQIILEDFLDKIIAKYKNVRIEGPFLSSKDTEVVFMIKAITKHDLPLIIEESVLDLKQSDEDLLSSMGMTMAKFLFTIDLYTQEEERKRLIGSYVA